MPAKRNAPSATSQPKGGGSPRSSSKASKPEANQSTQNEIEALASLANLGPKSAQALVASGISSFSEVQRLGSVATYARIKQSDPRVTLNLLWALEGALSGLSWQVVAKEHRTSLLLALDTLQNRQNDGSGTSAV
jgi:DNA transformation protein